MVYIFLVASLLVFRPGGPLMRRSVTDDSVFQCIVTAAFILVTALLLALPMRLASAWNGERPAWRNQYEVMAKSLLNGHIFLDYDDVDPRLEALENGRYYFYFGIVPVLMLFLPFHAVTGVSLTTYLGSVIYASGAVVGIFLLFKLLARQFFPRMALGTSLFFSMAFSCVSLWYVAQAPALYCTAIVSAVAMMVFSYYFFFKAVYSGKTGRRQTAYAWLGGLFGALSFGCRPPVAVANALAVPLVVVFFKRFGMNRKTVGKAFLAFLPYVLTAAGLMAYNYARFQNPLEFGQSYQLTVADQSGYGDFLSRFSLETEMKGLFANFFSVAEWKSSFPWVRYSGVFLNFPILLGTFLVFLPKTVKTARKQLVFGVTVVLFLLPVLITLLDVFYSPYLLERYRLDVYWLTGICAFLGFGFFLERLRTPLQEKVASVALTVLLDVTIVFAVLYFLVPQDASFTQEYPEVLTTMQKVMFFSW